MSSEIYNLQKELAAGRDVIVFTTGTSMEPLLHDKRKKNATHVLVKPVTETLTEGDLPLVLLKDGRYMIHRIIRVTEEEGHIFYRTRGDNCIGSERVAKEDVLGVVTEIYRKKKTIKVTDRGYLLYVKFRVGTYSVRRAFWKLKVLLAKVKRKIG